MKTLKIIHKTNEMSEIKCLEDKYLNLRSSDLKIKEELINFDNDIKNTNIFEIEVTPSGLSYGEVFIVENDHDENLNQDTPYMWWITCNICQDKFDNFEDFLNHATTIHLTRTLKRTPKIEHENLNEENLQNDIDAERNEEFPILDNSQSDPDYKLSDIADSDINESFTEVEDENEYIENITNKKSDEHLKKKSLLPRHCEKCNKTFKKPSTLRRHLVVHFKKDNKFYECKICQQKFTKEQKRLWRNHRDRAHKEKIPCTLCDKTFGSKFYLESHLKTHTGSKDFKCDQCSASFYSKTSLSGHIRKTHLTEKVPCQFCNKLFRKGSSLEIHVRIHTGEKPYVCEQCGSAFQTHSLLQNHIKRHNNDRRFECDICGKKFFNHTYLRDHKVTHTDEKPYGCDICNARFNSGPALRKHKNLHSGVKKYQCKICGKSYAQSPGLYAHMKSHNIAEDKSLKV